MLFGTLCCSYNHNENKDSVLFMLLTMTLFVSGFAVRKLAAVSIMEYCPPKDAAARSSTDRRYSTPFIKMYSDSTDDLVAGENLFNDFLGFLVVFGVHVRVLCE